MLEKLLFICLFTLIIHTIETLSYSVRLAGIRVAKLAVALSLFNIIVIVSRTANMLQAPLTASLVDRAKETGDLSLIESQFRVILGSASLGTLLAALLVPTFIAVFSRAIIHLETAGSIPSMLKNTLTIHHLQYARKHIRAPRWSMISRLRIGGVPKRLFLLNVLATMIYTSSILSCLYASLLAPQYSSIALMSSGLVNGFAAILLTIFVDPQVAILTDRVMRGEERQLNINKVIGVLIFSRFIGTLLAQLLFIPAAYYIAWISRFFA
ncbi:lipid II flippase Amj family protein [Aneurinibacillus sp. REN35]|uniref:lipid II flippase Amj family protein n=1 Tax=Aneurinibacillus sp. REN35 TaxID=3237286 RepID=UPI003526F377